MIIGYGVNNNFRVCRQNIEPMSYFTFGNTFVFQVSNFRVLRTLLFFRFSKTVFSFFWRSINMCWINWRMYCNVVFLWISRYNIYPISVSFSRTGFLRRFLTNLLNVSANAAPLEIYLEYLLMCLQVRKLVKIFIICLSWACFEFGSCKFFQDSFISRAVFVLIGLSKQNG